MSHLVQSIVAVLAITNPLSAALVFLSLTSDSTPPERRVLALRAAMAVAVILATAAVAGPAILQAFGISLAAFQAGGGLVILLMGLEMLRGSPTSANTSSSPGAAPDPASDSILVPFAMPLIAGPGSITTVITLASHGSTTGVGAVQTLVAVGIAAAVLLVTLLGADRIGGRVSGHAQGIILRFMGLILLAIGVQMVLTGIVHFVTPISG